MLGVLIVLIVLGFGLPVGLWLISRWRMSRPQKLYRGERHDEIDQWLTSEFNLGLADRARVRRSVLGRQAGDPLEPKRPANDPAPLAPALLQPARALAARVLADQVRSVRRSRRWGGVQLVSAVAYGGCGIFLLTGTEGGREQTLGGLFVVNACFAGCAGAVLAVAAPRRTRRNAEAILHSEVPGAQSRPA
jgi:hypothetical protein